MILLYINLAVCVIDLILFVLFVIDAAQQFKSRYPDLKIKRRSRASVLNSLIKMVVASICPLLNLVVLWILMLSSEEVMESTIKKMVTTASEEGEKNDI